MKVSIPKAIEIIDVSAQTVYYGGLKKFTRDIPGKRKTFNLTAYEEHRKQAMELKEIIEDSLSFLAYLRDIVGFRLIDIKKAMGIKNTSGCDLSRQRRIRLRVLFVFKDHIPAYRAYWRGEKVNVDRELERKYYPQTATQLKKLVRELVSTVAPEYIKEPFQFERYIPREDRRW